MEFADGYGFPDALCAVATVALDRDGVALEFYTDFPPREVTSGWFRRWAGNSEESGDAFGIIGQETIRRLIKRGEPVTFQAVQREAGVSHAFLYNHPDLRGRIERLRAQTRPIPAPAPPVDEGNTLVLALTSQITRLKKQHRDEVQALRDALEQAHGENLDLRRELARRGGDTPPSQALVIRRG
ncbi:DUF6262 family protein [Streptacidiphilus sp. EB129]|uniref:DUF6262 family protein n=1 Tax=Streptacidiphilus sp. EB129 TaxID=3156262 RepID=UPI003518CD80